MPRNILVIDEIANIRIQLKKELTKSKDLFVLTESFGKDGIRTLINRPDIDLLVLDLNLPDMNAIKFIKAMKLKNIEKPVIVISARPTSEDIVNLKNLGITNFFTKPLDIPKIEEKIKEILKIEKSEKK